MTVDETNDNNPNTANTEITRPSEMHGQAAMLLVESLLHGLVARSVISVADAVEIVDIASEIKAEIDAEGGEHRAPKKPRDVLASISASLQRDLPAK